MDAWQLESFGNTIKTLMEVNNNVYCKQHGKGCDHIVGENRAYQTVLNILNNVYDAGIENTTHLAREINHSD